MVLGLNLVSEITWDISSIIRQSFFPSKTIPKSRSVLKDGSKSLGLFRKGKTHIIAKFLRTDLVICSHSREEKNPSYSRINMEDYPRLHFKMCGIFCGNCGKFSYFSI